MKKFWGVFPVICIPFNEEEEVDEENLRRLVRFLIEKGTIDEVNTFW